jgi:hypothetical protein
MNEFVGTYQYYIAWSVYIASGAFFCLSWWKLTAVLNHSGWRDLLRGFSIIAIFTPWYTSATHEHFAPAAVVVMMDLLLGSTANGLTGSLALLMAAAAMLTILIVKRFWSPS